MDAVLFGLFAAGVHEYLRGVVGTAKPRVAGVGAGATGVGAVPGEIARLAAAWRVLLKQHALGADGRCVVCARAEVGFGWRRWFGWLPTRRRPGMCTVWQVAVAYFIRRSPAADP